MNKCVVSTNQKKTYCFGIFKSYADIHSISGDNFLTMLGCCTTNFKHPNVVKANSKC